MTNIRDYNCRICVNYENFIYKILTIWYHKDWWYYISDLWNEYFDYTATKVKTDIKNTDKNWDFFIPFSNLKQYSINLKKPKISHHIDWNSHISWDWILSWFDSNNNAKWLWLKSFNLNWYNDWGPVFWCSVKLSELDKFKKIKISNSFNQLNLDKNWKNFLNKYHVTLPINKLLTKFSFINKIFWKKVYNIFNSCLYIDWYYIHKSDLPSAEYLNKNNYIFTKLSNWIKIRLLPIKSPDNCPYVFWIHFRIDNIYNNSPILYFWASPWLKEDDWNWEIITLSVYDEKPNVKFTSLNYKE